MEEWSTSSCVPVKASQSPCSPIAGPITSPPVKSRGPRQNRPEYPASSLPCVPGLPNIRPVSRTLVSAVVMSRVQESAPTSCAVSVRRSSIQCSPAIVCQARSSVITARPRAVPADTVRLRIVPRFGRST
ncbi:hypothetical protein VR46_35700 [Streptomyces sp. NRRL S-444]|nr:hypothetical protein VR46_35700 [Streptomyces sp. NRRL S-444]